MKEQQIIKYTNKEHMNKYKSGELGLSSLIYLAWNHEYVSAGITIPIKIIILEIGEE
jgi:hypothetical protein